MAPPDEYDCTDRVRRRCGLMLNYFDHLLLLRYGGGRKYRDECVCLSVCLLVSMTSRSNFTVSSALVADGSSSLDDSGIRYLFPVLWMASCFHVMRQTGDVKITLRLGQSAMVAGCADQR